MLQVIDPAQYADAAALLARANVDTAHVASALFDAIADAALSAGRGDGTRRWCAAYEQAAGEVGRQLSALVDALGSCAILLDACGHNHGRAEAAAAPYGLPAYALPRIQRDLASVSMTGVPPLYGGDADEPRGWGIISAHLFSPWWPGANLAGVRALAAAWHTAADGLGATVSLPRLAVAELDLMTSPELADATSVCQRLAEAGTTLAADCDALGTACGRFADDVQEQRDRVDHLVKEFCGVAGITELLALGASFLSAGISELVAKAVDSGLMAVYAGRIGAVLDALSDTLQASSLTLAVSDASRGLSTWLPAVASAQPVLAALDDDTRVLRAELDGGPGPGAAALSDEEVIAAGWARRKTLKRHFEDHGADVGATTEADYVRAALALLRRAQAEGLPTKVAEDGDILVFDPESELFGVYRPDGRTRTLYRPDAPAAEYWANQRGVLQ
jgi:hypothetical protein